MEILGWDYIFFFVIYVTILPRILFDNYHIGRNYQKMSVQISDAIAVTEKTKIAFRGFFKWCARTHYFMSYMAIGHFAHWAASPTQFESVVILVELIIMMLIHYPEKGFTDDVLDRFFNVDLKQLEAKLYA